MSNKSDLFAYCRVNNSQIFNRSDGSTVFRERGSIVYLVNICLYSENILNSVVKESVHLNLHFIINVA